MSTTTNKIDPTDRLDALASELVQIYEATNKAIRQKKKEIEQAAEEAFVGLRFTAQNGREVELTEVGVTFKYGVGGVSVYPESFHYLKKDGSLSASHSICTPYNTLYESSVTKKYHREYRKKWEELEAKYSQRGPIDQLTKQRMHWKMRRAGF